MMSQVRQKRTGSEEGGGAFYLGHVVSVGGRTASLRKEGERGDDEVM